MHPLLLQIYAAILPPLLAIFSVWLSRALSGVAAVAKDRWGIEIEARHRDALHSALMTGVTSALSQGLSGQAAISAAIDHVLKRGAPDAAEFFGLDIQGMQELARAKLQQASLNATLVDGVFEVSDLADLPIRGNVADDQAQTGHSRR